MQGGACAPILFELAGEICLLFVPQTGGGFLDGEAAAQEFNGVVLPLSSQPDAGQFSHALEEVAAQRGRGQALVRFVFLAGFFCFSVFASAAVGFSSACILVCSLAFALLELPNPTRIAMFVTNQTIGMHLPIGLLTRLGQRFE